MRITPTTPPRKNTTPSSVGPGRGSDECQGRSFVAIDRRAFDLGDWIARGFAVANQVRESTVPRRRIVDGVACSLSRMNRSHAMTALWSAWRSSAGMAIPPM
jgi:hypothetical protein